MSFQPLVTYVKQARMFDAMRKSSIDERTRLIVSQDIGVRAGGAKRFFHVPLDPEAIARALRTNGNAYEIIRPDVPVKPYFDLEMEGEEMTPKYSRGCLDQFLSWFTDEIAGLFEITLTAQSYLILDSCRANKLSYHVIVNEAIIFESELAQKHFMEYLFGRFANPRDDAEARTFEKLSWTKSSGEILRIMDVVVYKNNQSLRLANQTKCGKDHILKLLSRFSNTPVADPNGGEFADPDAKSEWSLLDTLAVSYLGCCDGRQTITAARVATIVDRQAPKQTSKNARTNTKSGGRGFSVPFSETEFLTTGQTLMVAKDMSENDLLEFPPWKRSLYLIPNSSQPYSITSRVGFALRGVGATVEDYREWAKLSAKYYPGSSLYVQVENTFEKLVSDRMGAPTLLKYAKAANPDYFRGAPAEIEAHFAINTSGVRVIKEKCRFVSMEGTEDGNNIFDPAKQIVLHAYLGRGKTTAIGRALKDATSYLFLSSRQTFAKFIKADFGCDCYLDVKKFGEDDVYRSKKLVCSLESLLNIELHETTYDVIVFDESESILAQFSSPTMGNKQIEIWKCLEARCLAAKKIIYADAFLTDRTLDYARGIAELHDGESKNITLIKNDTPAVNRTCREVRQDDFSKTLVAGLLRGEKPFCVYSSVTQLINDMAVVRGAAIVEEKLQTSLDGALIYHARTDDAVFRTMENMNETWQAATMVVTSPVTTIGCSFSPEGDPSFDDVYVSAAPTCCVRDTFQSQMRVRHLRGNRMIYCFPPPQKLRFVKMNADLQYDLFEAFENANKSKTNLVATLLSKLKLNCDGGQLAHLNPIFDEKKATPIGLLRLYFANAKEASMSSANYVELFRAYLKRCGYVESGVALPTFEGACAAHAEHLQYSDIPVIDGSGHLEQLELHIKTKTATALQKVMVRRYFFDDKINDDVRGEAREQLFNLHAQPHHARQLENLSRLLDGTLAFGEDMKSGTLTNMIGPRVHYVRTLNGLLGIRNVDLARGGTVASCAALGRSINYLNQNEQGIRVAFSLRPRSGGERYLNFKSALCLVRAIYKHFGGITLVGDGTKKRKLTQFEMRSPYSFVKADLFRRSAAEDCGVRHADEYFDVDYFGEDVLVPETTKKKRRFGEL